MRNFIEELEDRGLVHQMTDRVKLSVLAQSDALNFYIGFDPTADCLHVGSFIQLRIIKLALAMGVPCTVVLGTFTGQIGDPTGKTKERQALDRDTVFDNARRIMNLIKQICADTLSVPEFMLNHTWYGDSFTFDDFLKVASHFSVNKLVALETMKRRLDEGEHLSLRELLYPTVQAMDFEYLFEHHGCNLQIGGSDQWGNITQGTELIHKNLRRSAFGLTTPLLTNAAGEKMGKTANGAIWLDAERTSVLDFWQFWRNVEDEKVQQYLLMLTDVHPNDIAEAISVDINEAKILLADDVTLQIHGETGLAQARAEVDALFNGGVLPPYDLPVKFKTRALVDLVREATGRPRSECKRLCKQNAVRVGDEIIVDPNTPLDTLIPIKGRVDVKIGKTFLKAVGFGDASPE